MIASLHGRAVLNVGKGREHGACFNGESWKFELQNEMETGLCSERSVRTIGFPKMRVHVWVFL